MRLNVGKVLEIGLAIWRAIRPILSRKPVSRKAVRSTKQKFSKR